jgi:CO/xanthine dehydrogenase FAD-binding subunit
MIVEYHRPETLTEALNLLNRKYPTTVPLGGGTTLTKYRGEDLAVVDLQSLGLNKVERDGKWITIGSTSTLQQLLEFQELNPVLKLAIQLEATNNTRQIATIAGVLVSADGRSSFATSMLALAAKLILLPGEKDVYLGDFFPVRAQLLIGKLISKIIVPGTAKLAYHYVSRTPEDLPIVCVAVAKWPSGRTRVAMGGFGPSPIIAMDGPESIGAVEAARNAFIQADDAWASGEYREEVAGVLVNRCLNDLNSEF